MRDVIFEVIKLLKYFINFDHTFSEVPKWSTPSISNIFLLSCVKILR